MRLVSRSNPVDTFIKDVNIEERLRHRSGDMCQNRDNIDKVRRFCKKDLLPHADVLRRTDSIAYERGKQFLKIKIFERKSLEAQFSPKQRFFYRVAGILKRGAFKTKNESANTIYKKMVKKSDDLNGTHSEYFLSRLASISNDPNGNKVYLKIAEKRFEIFLQNIDAPIDEDDFNIVLKQYQFLDASSRALNPSDEQQLTKSFLRKISDYHLIELLEIIKDNDGAKQTLLDATLERSESNLFLFYNKLQPRGYGDFAKSLEFRTAIYNSVSSEIRAELRDPNSHS